MVLMQTNWMEADRQRKTADVVVVPFWHEKKKAAPACQVKEFAQWIKHPLQEGDFQGKEGETLLLYRSTGKEKRILLLGLGQESTCLPDVLRKASAAVVKAVKGKKLRTVNFFLPETELIGKEVAARAIFEGVLLASYDFVMLKGNSLEEERQGQIERFTFIGDDPQGAMELERAEVVINSVNFVRDLVNGNADEVTSQSLSAFAKGLEQQYSLVKATILDKKALEKEGMGLMLAVNRGATRDPALIILEYKGDPDSSDWTAIVGKGITFDTGGLNLKPSGSIEEMKCDMAGAAATLGVVQAAAELKLKCNILAALAVAENAIGPNSYKPGDVVRSHAGKTIEINNTDAEGRLVLADAISYLQTHYRPSRLIDMATLTGGIVVALGEQATGLFSNDDALAKSLYRAGERTHERLWRMPLFPEHKEMLKSGIADMKNSAGKWASSCTGAAFLQQFIRHIPWAHLDIAGTAFLSEKKGYHTTPATGVGVRLLIDFLEHLDGDGKKAQHKRRKKK
jgi:leucyl aminopeptidase